MRFANLVLALSLLGMARSDSCGEPCPRQKVWAELPREAKWDIRSADLTPKQIWAHVVAGEAGGWEDGARLVAWTLRAWEVRRGMPAEMAGPRWGWHAWDKPNGMHRQIVDEVWGQPLEAAPYEWMRAGNYCYALGSHRDADYWMDIGWYGFPDLKIDWPGTSLGMNCYFGPP